MAKFYVSSDNNWTPVPNSIGNLKEQLEAGFYVLNVGMEGWDLDQKVLPTLPNKVFGKADIKTNFFLKRFKELNRSMGVWFDGVKGSGKTVTANMLCHKLVADNFPVISLRSSVSGSTLLEVSEKIGRPFAVLIDEFEKIYGTSLSDSGNNGSEDLSAESQKTLLGFLDGVNPIPVLTIITTNERTRVSSLIRGRTGRIRYFESFGFLSEEEVKEVAKFDHPEISDSDLAILLLQNGWNLDSLRAVIQDIRDTKDPANQVVQRMNIDFYYDEKNWEVFLNGKSLGFCVTSYGTLEEYTIQNVLHESFRIRFDAPLGNYKHCEPLTKVKGAFNEETSKRIEEELSSKGKGRYVMSSNYSLSQPRKINYDGSVQIGEFLLVPHKISSQYEFNKDSMMSYLNM